MEKIRAFVAISLPENIKNHIRAVQAEFKNQGLKMRWVRPENIHITLKFLGDIKKSDIENIEMAMENGARGISPLKLMVKGAGVFPGLRRPRVLWAGLKGDTGHLLNFWKELDKNLDKAGFPSENRPFKAHLTIARIKQAIDTGKLVEMMEKFAQSESEAFIAGKITLYQSRLKPSGPVYTKLKEVSLAGKTR